MSEKKLILNADDFGRHELINQAVERGVTQGYLRSATLMPGEPCFDGAVALAKAHPELGVGIHFTLVDGHPVLPPAEIPSLVTAEGKFYPQHNAFVKAYLTGKIDLADVRRELTAQLDKFLAAGLVPTHADSHQHIHILPGIFPVVLDILAAKGIYRVRIPKVHAALGAFFSGGLADIIGRLGLWTLAALGKPRPGGVVLPHRRSLLARWPVMLWMNSSCWNWRRTFRRALRRSCCTPVWRMRRWRKSVAGTMITQRNIRPAARLQSGNCCRKMT